MFTLLVGKCGSCINQLLYDQYNMCSAITMWEAKAGLFAKVPVVKLDQIVKNIKGVLTVAVPSGSDSLHSLVWSTSQEIHLRRFSSFALH